MNKVSEWLEEEAVASQAWHDRFPDITVGVILGSRAIEAHNYAELVERLVKAAKQAAVAIRNSNADGCAADRLEEALAAIQGGEVGNE